MIPDEDLCAGWQEDLTPDLADEETLAPAATGDEGNTNPLLKEN